MDYLNTSHLIYAHTHVYICFSQFSYLHAMVGVAEGGDKRNETIGFIFLECNQFRERRPTLHNCNKSATLQNNDSYENQ